MKILVVEDDFVSRSVIQSAVKKADRIDAVLIYYYLIVFIH